MTPEQDRLLREVHAELFKRHPNRAAPGNQPLPGPDGKVADDTLAGFVANSDGYGYRAEHRLLVVEAALVDIRATVGRILDRLKGA